MFQPIHQSPRIPFQRVQNDGDGQEKANPVASLPFLHALFELDEQIRLRLSDMGFER